MKRAAKANAQAKVRAKPKNQARAANRATGRERPVALGVSTAVRFGPGQATPAPPHPLLRLEEFSARGASLDGQFYQT